VIHLFTDFGWAGPYVGEMKAVLARELPQMSVIDLMHDAPAFNPRASAYLLAALSRRFQPGDSCLAVVDPGVGDAARRVLMLEVDGVLFVGPDNGLFALLARRANQLRCREVMWRPEEMSSSFHGRDWFAPLVARACKNIETDARDVAHESLVGRDWPDQLAEVIFIDHYGNVVTGLCADKCPRQSAITVAGRELRYAKTFSAVEPGQPFWYENSMGLVEIAVNGAHAADRLGMEIGTPVLCE